MKANLLSCENLIEQTVPPLRYFEQPHAMSVRKINNYPQQQYGESDHHIIPPVELQLVKPCALLLTKPTQIHRIGNILTGNNCVHRHGDDQRRDASDLVEYPAFCGVQLKSTRPLGVQSYLEITRQGRDEAKREFHRVGQPVRQAQFAKGHAIRA